MPSESSQKNFGVTSDVKPQQTKILELKFVKNQNFMKKNPDFCGIACRVCSSESMPGSDRYILKPPDDGRTDRHTLINEYVGIKMIPFHYVFQSRT